MSKTKQLKPGYPVVGDNGAITCMTIDEIAKRVGDKLGVQRASYSLPKEGGWLRIARVNTDSAIILFTNDYIGAIGRGVMLEYSGCYDPSQCDAIFAFGSTTLFSKVRFVGNKAEIYLEIYVDAKSASTPISMTLISSRHKETASLYDKYQEGAVSEGFSVKELTRADLMNRGG